MKKRYIIKASIVILSAFLLSFTATQIASRIQVTRSISTFGAILKSLDNLYVDSLDFKKLSKTAISAMLKEVDPYTEYYSEEDLSKASIITKGEYAGIGAHMQERGEGIVIRHVYPGSPAGEAGIKISDELIALDDQPVKGWGIQKVTDYLKGKPGEKVKLKIKRPGVKNEIEVTLERQIIKMPIVPYYGLVKNNVGYIKLSSFSSETTADEFKKVLEDLMSKNAKSLLIDLRNNGGGRMDHAIRICSYFLPKGSHILTMKGKTEENTKAFYTETEPIIPESIPVVVLVNGNTASASEIVSGALQDYDRAVIVGERSFGKGLVQTVINMPYKGQMKYTSAKYYIPSGRCVQAINYDHSQQELVKAVVPDSLLKPFKTKAGRTVYEGSGIMPDKKVEFTVPVPDSFAEMEIKDIFFDFGTEYGLKHKTLPKISEFEITKADIQSFEAFLKKKAFSFENPSQKKLDSLLIQTKKDGLYDQNKALFNQLKNGLSTNLHNDIVKNDRTLKQRLGYELLSRYYGEAEITQYQLRGDPQYDAALELLSDTVKYYSLLKR